jgi:5-methylthioribose kinase
MLELLAQNVDSVAAHLRKLDWISADEALLALEPAGAGNMNRTLRARLPKRTLVLKQSVPFVAKYPSIPAPADRIAVEAAFYRATTKPPALSMRLPRVLGFDPDNRLLALEDLGESADFSDVYAHRSDAAQRTDITSGHMTALLYWIGMLHGLRIDARRLPELENREMRRLNHAHIFDIPLRTDNGIDLDATTPGLAAVARDFCGDAALRERVSALGEIYLGNARHASPRALLHGDYYPGSWLRHPRMGVMIIDPEFAFVGPPEFDIGVLIAHFTFARIPQNALMLALSSYNAPARFSFPLALAFGGVEVIRRLLGVAQLPLAADLETKRAWLVTARQFATAS